MAGGVEIRPGFRTSTIYDKHVITCEKDGFRRERARKEDSVVEVG